ncbi:MAG: 3-isopropylmalate dehydrogenase [Lachnospiraceae bacterium]|nr:3-isopropylmalate dehydrogenase [Lachnospiraceae bacterium]
MEKNIAVIRGDGIGPEIVEQAVKVLTRIAGVFGHTFTYTDVDMGGCAIDRYGEPLPPAMLEKCLVSDSVLLGAVGGPKWNDVAAELRPEKGLLKLRSGMGVYSNNRPARIWPQLADASPLKKSIVEKGIDFIIVRELTGGIYFGEHRTEESGGRAVATDILRYGEDEIERIGRIGFETARKRNKRLCSVEKSNVLDSSRLWKRVMHRLADEYSDVELSDMLVDNCAMQIVRDPSQFDVIVTENMFGDILSDEASMITGSIGMIPSSSLGATSRGLYEPIHGSAPDIAGTDAANPIGTILSAAMMLRYSFDMAKEADAAERAVTEFLDEGYRTADIMGDGMKKVGCIECGDIITGNIRA